MDIFKHTANDLRITPPELVDHIIRGMMNPQLQDKQTRDSLVDRIMTKYETEGALPPFVMDYCANLQAQARRMVG